MSKTTLEPGQVPAWLNVAAFDLPEEHLDTVRRITDQLIPVAQLLVDLVPEALAASTALSAATDGHNSDDVMAAMFVYTGQERLWELLYIVGDGADVVTGEHDLPSFLTRCRRFGLSVPELA